MKALAFSDLFSVSPRVNLARERTGSLHHKGTPEPGCKYRVADTGISGGIIRYPLTRCVGHPSVLYWTFESFREDSQAIPQGQDTGTASFAALLLKAATKDWY